MTTNININEIKEKLNTKLIESGWARVLRGFIFSNEFDTILLTLIKDSQEDRRFTPFIKYVFRAFEECPYDELKVVLIGQDPYNGIEQSDGLAFSCAFEKKPLPALEYLLQAVNDTVYESESISTDKDLKRWSNQGILMLNSALTTTIGKPNSHVKLWRPMMAYLLDYLKIYNPGLCYILMGRTSEQLVDYLSEKDPLFILTHPMNAISLGKKKWPCDDVFRKVSEITKKNYNFDIKW